MNNNNTYSFTTYPNPTSTYYPTTVPSTVPVANIFSNPTYRNTEFSLGRKNMHSKRKTVPTPQRVHKMIPPAEPQVLNIPPDFYLGYESNQQ